MKKMKMKKSLMVVLSVLILAGLCVVIFPYAFTVVSIQEIEEVKQSEAFDPVAWVDSVWDSRLYPTIMESAVDLKLILNEMDVDSSGVAAKTDLTPIAEAYGLITVGEAHVYMVKGRGQVINVNTSSSTGTMELLLDGYTGPIKVMLYIGTRIPSDETSIRDSVGFISFGDFREQTEYGKVASELNKRVNTLVLDQLDKDNLQGKTFSFTGAFTVRTFNLININLSEIRVVPVQLVME
jgi:predicted lipoprotein